MPQDPNLQKLIQRRHPEYEGLLPHWNFLEATYKGGRAWFEQNIHRYLKEGDTEYADRVKRAYRFNHTREVVDLVNKYLMRKSPQRNYEDASPLIRDFWDNVDRAGTDIDEFMRLVSQQSSIFGCPWIVVDSTKVPTLDSSRPVSILEAEESGLRTYAYLIKPQQVIDLAYDENDGRLLWILIEEYYRDDADPFISSGDLKPRYRLWTRTDWYLFVGNTSAASSIGVYSGSNRRLSAAQLSFELAEQEYHGLGLVPVVRADNIISDEPYSCPALINDVAYLDKAVANYLSNLDAIIQDQTFSQLAIPAQNLMPGTGEIDDEGVEKENPEYRRLIEMGTKRIFVFDGENGQKPFFLSPDPRQAELILSAIQQIINEIYHSIGLAGERTKQDNSQGIDNSSGVAKSKDFERVNSLLLSKADALERVENSLIEIVRRWGGETAPANEEDLVIYPESFDVQGLFDEFDVAGQLMKLQVPEAIRGEQFKRMIGKMFEGRGRKFIEEMERHIEDWVDHIVEQREMMAEQREMMAETAQATLDAAKEAPVRDEQGIGKKQSQTKTRQEKRRKESDQETGQGE